MPLFNSVFFIRIVKYERVLENTYQLHVNASWNSIVFQYEQYNGDYQFVVIQFIPNVYLIL